MGARVTVDGLRLLVEELVATYAAAAGAQNWWRKPLLATAQADERFDILPEIAFDGHFLPSQLLSSVKAVVVFFLPFTIDLVNENSPGKFPCRNWGLAYEATNELIGMVAERMQDYLAGGGYQSALTPATHNFDEVRLVSRWSHKHLAYLSALGRFGVNAQLITPSGCAGRLGSLVTEADLGDSPLVEAQELCLHKAGQQCLKCAERCPVQAVGEHGIDRKCCWDRLRFNIERTEKLSGLHETTHVCGKCAVNVPCSVDPLARLP
ncbi:MAG: epoxyqueuosine reductase [Deltaproteobacteria bacterium]|nr:MAG: epoxyqueuosine reductase [Deltaproteobacteria bacterium]